MIWSLKLFGGSMPDVNILELHDKWSVFFLTFFTISENLTRLTERCSFVFMKSAITLLVSAYTFLTNILSRQSISTLFAITSLVRSNISFFFPTVPTWALRETDWPPRVTDSLFICWLWIHFVQCIARKKLHYARYHLIVILYIYFACFNKKLVWAFTYTFGYSVKGYHWFILPSQSCV